MRWLLIAPFCLLAGCSTLPRLDAVPPQFENRARVNLPGVPAEIRFRVGDAASEAALASEFVQDSAQIERKTFSIAERDGLDFNLAAKGFAWEKTPAGTLRRERS